jgi:glycosyltransferase involved in cell wall biosynthesis
MRAMNLADSAIAAGHKVKIWTGDFYHQEKKHRHGKSVRQDITDKLSIQFVKSSGYKKNISIGRFWDHLVLAYELRKLLRKEDSPDVAVVGFPPIEPAWVMTRWLNARNAPVICDVQDQWPDYFLTEVPTKLHSVAKLILIPFYFLGKFCFKNATGIVSITPEFLSWSLNRAGRSNSKSDKVVPQVSRNTESDYSELSKAEKFWLENYVSQNFKFRVCFVGSLSPAFDFSFLRDVLQFPNWQFIICGTGSELKGLEESYKGFPQIVFPGWINTAQAEILASLSTVSIAPYRSERSFEMSIPNKIYDYLRFGLPVLSSLGGVTQQLLQINSAGFTYNSREEFANLLYDFETWDKSEFSEFSKRNKLLASTQFSYESVYGEYISHLESLAEFSGP